MLRIVPKSSPAGRHRPRKLPALPFALLVVLGFSFTTVAEEITVNLPGNVSLILVKIPKGTFMMGSPSTERGRYSDETQHQVTLTQDYYLGKYEVTQQQWQAVMGTASPTRCSSGRPPRGVGDNHPVVCVSWNDIAGPGGFIERLNHLLETTKFRLPTEAEWERAARAGTKTRFSPRRRAGVR